MAGEGITAKVQGLPDLKAALLSIPDKLRRRALTNALKAAARVVQKEARSRTPVLQLPSPYRTPGLVRKAISVRSSKIAKRAGDVGVFVNVKPLPGAKGIFGTKRRVLVRASQRSAKNPNDPFYWKFVEFGTKKMPARPFLQAGAKRLGEALQVFIQKIGPQIQKLNGGKDVQL